MGFVLQARKVRVAPKTFSYAALGAATDSGSDAKSCPEPLEGGNPVARVWMAHVEVLEESCRRWSELEQRNATSLNVCPVRCNDVAWSTPAPHHRRRPSLAPLLSTPTSQHGSAKWADQTSPNQLSSFFAPRILRHGLFFFHSLTSCSLYSPPPPTLLFFLRRGVVFRSPSCHTGPPTLTHGGREGAREGVKEAGRKGERNRTPTCCRRSSMIVEDYFSRGRRGGVKTASTGAAACFSNYKPHSSLLLRREIKLYASAL